MITTSTSAAAAITTTAATTAATTTVEESDHHDHDDDDHTDAPDNATQAGPSPTESVGCEPHGDHWHCEGPKATEATGPVESAAASTSSSVGGEQQSTLVTATATGAISSTRTAGPGAVVTAGAAKDPAAMVGVPLLGFAVVAAAAVGL